MKTIYKYGHLPLERFAATTTVTFHEGAEIVHVGVQNEHLCFWAVVDLPEPGSPPSVRKTFRIVGTGHPVEDGELDRMKHVGTVQFRGGTLVFHIFEVPE